VAVVLEGVLCPFRAAAISVETTHKAETPHPVETKHALSMKSFRGMRSFHVVATLMSGYPRPWR
jgi:hypothetical protein